MGPGAARERALVDATAAFFQDPEAEEWWPRIRRWSEAMGAAYRSHPEDDEIAAFYGLSLLSVGQVADDRLAHHARAAEILAGLHERAPRHPGAIHYIIHADDASGRAEKHLEIVERYSDIAPKVPHALHMPSHIYVRLGNWNEVIRWNRRSASAALERSPGDRVSLHHLHALDYLIYAHLQRGNDEAAAAVLRDRVVDERRYQENFVSAYHLAVMPARYAVERRAWEEAARIQAREPGYLAWERYAWPRALSWFTRGMGAARTGDLATAREAERQMADIEAEAREKGEEGFATEIEIDRLVLEGWIAHAEGDADTAVDRMRDAAELEATIEKNPVSPGALLPPYEALGDLLMEMDQPREAQEAYEASLDIWPRRYRSLLGAARAAREAGHRLASREHYETLLQVVQGAARHRPGVREAEAAVGTG
jgi:tetratricopeptide (TPR) repeat protein